MHFIGTKCSINRSSTELNSHQFHRDHTRYTTCVFSMPLEKTSKCLKMRWKNWGQNAQTFLTEFWPSKKEITKSRKRNNIAENCLQPKVVWLFLILDHDAQTMVWKMEPWKAWKGLKKCLKMPQGLGEIFAWKSNTWCTSSELCSHVICWTSTATRLIDWLVGWLDKLVGTKQSWKKMALNEHRWFVSKCPWSVHSRPMCLKMVWNFRTGRIFTDRTTVAPSPHPAPYGCGWLSE